MGLFDKLESKLEQGVNGAFARAFKSEVQPVEIASGIRRAMDDRAARVGRGKRPIVPNLFTIELSPTDYDRLSAWGDDLDDELIASAQEHADEQRYLPGGPLTIVLTESDTLETGVFRLRPATAKAADAIAHQRSHPRRDNFASSDGDGYGHDVNGASGHTSDVAGAGRVAHLPGTHSGVDRTGSESTGNDSSYDDYDGAGHAPAGSPRPAPTGRTFGVRMKDYLLGTTTPAAAATASSTHPDDAAVNEYERDDERASYDRDGHPSSDAYGAEYDEAPRHDDAAAEYDTRDAYGSGYASADDYARDDRADASNAHDVSYRDASYDEYDEYSDARSGHGSYGNDARGQYGYDQRDDAASYADSGHDDDFDTRSAGTRNPAAHDPYARDNHAPGPYAAANHAATPARRAPARHAWDDDDSDMGDPTGFEPAPQRPNRPRAMSPRERPWLKIDGQRYPLLGAITVLGRDDDADIIVDDPGVSRRHSEVRITHDGPHLVMSVRDLGSTNGTYVNGDRIDSMHVHDGDRLTLGRTPMTIHLGDRP